MNSGHLPTLALPLPFRFTAQHICVKTNIILVIVLPLTVFLICLFASVLGVLRNNLKVNGMISKTKFDVFYY